LSLQHDESANLEIRRWEGRLRSLLVNSKWWPRLDCRRASEFTESPVPTCRSAFAHRPLRRRWTNGEESKKVNLVRTPNIGSGRAWQVRSSAMSVNTSRVQ